MQNCFFWSRREAARGAWHEQPPRGGLCGCPGHLAQSLRPRSGRGQLFRSREWPDWGRGSLKEYLYNIKYTARGAAPISQGKGQRQSKGKTKAKRKQSKGKAKAKRRQNKGKTKAKPRQSKGKAKAKLGSARDGSPRQPETQILDHLHLGAIL